MHLYLMTKNIQKIFCGCTKSEAIVIEVLAPASVEAIINVLSLNMLKACHCVFWYSHKSCTGTYCFHVASTHILLIFIVQL